MYSYSKWLAALSWQSPIIEISDFKLDTTPLGANDFLQLLRSDEKFAAIGVKDLSFATNNLNLMEERGIEFLFPTHECYPKSFQMASSPPLALCVLGSPNSLNKKSLAVVGSRKPLPLSLQWMDFNLIEILKVIDLVVISGGARGVDQKAHSIALRSNRQTVCFLPSGVLNPYPREIGQWIKPITEAGGCVISPYPPLKEMFKGHFHSRNRLIAALASVVLVIQANRKSGTMLTARMAIEEGKEIGVLPYFPLESCGQGSLDLIAEGAQMIRDSVDLEVFLNLNGL